MLIQYSLLPADLSAGSTPEFFVADVDTAFEEESPHVTAGAGKAVVEAHSVSDDRFGEGLARGVGS